VAGSGTCEEISSTLIGLLAGGTAQPLGVDALEDFLLLLLRLFQQRPGYASSIRYRQYMTVGGNKLKQPDKQKLAKPPSYSRTIW
jgi:hypothetical protein